MATEPEAAPLSEYVWTSRRKKKPGYPGGVQLIYTMRQRSHTGVYHRVVAVVYQRSMREREDSQYECGWELAVGPYLPEPVHVVGYKLKDMQALALTLTHLLGEKRWQQRKKPTS